jgi:hypothetical protein
MWIVLFILILENHYLSPLKCYKAPQKHVNNIQKHRKTRKQFDNVDWAIKQLLFISVVY